MKPKLDKETVASRQLDTAIDLMFGGDDIVSVQTLASASSAIFADLLRAKGEKAWRDEIVECFPGNRPRNGSYETILRGSRPAAYWFQDSSPAQHRTQAD